MTHQSRLPVDKREWKECNVVESKANVQDVARLVGSPRAKVLRNASGQGILVQAIVVPIRPTRWPLRLFASPETGKLIVFLLALCSEALLAAFNYAIDCPTNMHYPITSTADIGPGLRLWR